MNVNAHVFIQQLCRKMFQKCKLELLSLNNRCSYFKISNRLSCMGGAGKNAAETRVFCLAVEFLCWPHHTVVGRKR